MRGVRLVVLSALSAVALWAADAPKEVIDPVGDGNGQINWSTGVITATGFGPKQDNVPAGRQRAMQRRVAITDGYRLLAETVRGVHVTSETTVKNYELVDDTITTRVDALLRGFAIVDEGTVPEDGSYYVTLSIPLRGSEGSVQEIIIPKIPTLEPQAIQRAQEEPPAPTTPVTPTTPETPTTPPPPETPRIDVPENPPPPPTQLPERKPGPYTGLIVDTRGFHIDRAMSPKIKMADGSECWGTVQVSREFVLDQGIVSYMPTLDMALDPNVSRAGTNPLTVRAIGREGAFKANAVVADDDAKLILDENQKSRFLDEFKVVFVVDQEPLTMARRL